MKATITINDKSQEYEVKDVYSFDDTTVIQLEGGTITIAGVDPLGNNFLIVANDHT